jgi:acyl carrier protein
MDIQAELQEIFRKVFEDTNLEINNQMTANDVAKWTSLTHLIMIEHVENHFKIKLTLKELIKLKNVGDLLALIQQKTS